MNNCNMCVHNKVCRLKNVCEKICKKIDECLDITTDEKESFEVGQFEVEIKCKDFELAVPRTRGSSDDQINWNEKGLEVFGNKTKHPCEGCPWFDRIEGFGAHYLGDTPCQWCDKNPMRVTCSDLTYATSKPNPNLKLTGRSDKDEETK